MVINMYLHIGNNMAVRQSDIVGVFDMDNTTVSKRGRNYLNKAQKNGEIINAAEDLPRTYIVTHYNGKNRVYITSISCAALMRRVKASGFLAE